MDPLTALAWVGVIAVSLVVLAIAVALGVVIVRAALAADIGPKRPTDELKTKIAPQPTGPRAVK